MKIRAALAAATLLLAVGTAGATATSLDAPRENPLHQRLQELQQMAESARMEPPSEAVAAHRQQIHDFAEAVEREILDNPQVLGLAALLIGLASMVACIGWYFMVLIGHGLALAFGGPLIFGGWFLPTGSRTLTDLYRERMRQKSAIG